MPQDKVLRLTDWHTPASDYAEGQVGQFRLHRDEYPAGHTYSYYFMDGYGVYQTLGSLPMMLLQEQRNGEWQDWMIDDPINYRAIQKYSEVAKGKVLVAGLGLGLIVHELAANPNVSEVTVVECSPEVVGLVYPYVPKDKLTLFLADFWDFVPGDDIAWDTIIVDIWATKGKEQHQAVLWDEVMPACLVLRSTYPGARLIVHGFPMVSDIQLSQPYEEVWANG